MSLKTGKEEWAIARNYFSFSLVKVENLYDCSNQGTCDTIDF